MTTNYLAETDQPQERLRSLARAGFTHVFWCQEWCTSHVYSPDEITAIGMLMDELGIRLLDLHAPHGEGMGWGSFEEAERRTALALIRNRIGMAGVLGGEAVILHMPPRPEDPSDLAAWRDNLRRSLDELTFLCGELSVRIAIENAVDDDFDDISELVTRFCHGFLGICYDAGHGNIGQDGLAHLENLKDRLVAVHLHDNHGSTDEHLIPFEGTVDWKRLTRIIAESPYPGCVNLECKLGESEDAGTFLRKACESAVKLAGMIRAVRSGT
jgi:sugar phosphate isomerase/epimerase